MSQLQLICDEIAKEKMEIRDIKELYKSQIEQMTEHAEIVEQIKILQEKKKQLEYKAQESLGTAWDKLESLNSAVKAEKEIMTDVALNDLMKGQTVEIEDSFGNKYEPKWSVKFIKVQ